MDTAIIALLVGYESLAFAWGASKILPGSPPLITEMLDTQSAPVRGGFVLVLLATMLDHLSLLDIPIL